LEVTGSGETKRVTLQDRIHCQIEILLWKGPRDDIEWMTEDLISDKSGGNIPQQSVANKSYDHETVEQPEL
jgi:hypothetical protein